MASKKKPIAKKTFKAAKKTRIPKGKSIKTKSGTKGSQAELAAREKSYRDLFNSIEDAIYIQEQDGTFVDVNAGACAMYGYEKKDFIGQTPAFLSADDKNDFFLIKEKMKKAYGGTPQSLEFWARKKDGEVFLKEVRLRRGSYFGKYVVITTARDITARKRIEEELKESERRFRTLQQASFGGIGMHDKGIIIECNQGLCDITGYTRSELIGFDGLNLIAPEWRDIVREKIRVGYEDPYDVEGIHKDGLRYYLEVRAKNVPFRGRIVRVTEFRNITDRKLTEEKIKEQNARLIAVTDELRRKNDQLEEFTQIVSHNLRSPVGNTLTLLTLLETAVDDSERAEYISLLKESSLTAQQTLLELHDVLKIKQNKQIQKQNVRFEDVFRHVESMLSARITETSAKVTGDFDDAPSIIYPNIYLESIFLNLMSNSLKYVHADVAPIILFRTYRSNDSMVLEVSDNGVGINLHRYGHQVFKLHKTFHRHPESRGIGLFMIKNQIETLGGEISIASQENKGTTIFVNFNKHAHDESASAHRSIDR